MEKNHSWRMRLIVGAIMIALAFVGLIIANVEVGGAWQYWRMIVPVFALLSLWLSWYLRSRGHSLSVGKIGHEIIHWVGVLGAIYLITRFVKIGMIGRDEASLVIVVVLALSLFLAGVYIEITFMLIGIILGLLAVGSAFAEAYLYILMIPVFIIGLAVLGWIAYSLHKTASK